MANQSIIKIYENPPISWRIFKFNFDFLPGFKNRSVHLAHLLERPLLVEAVFDPLALPASGAERLRAVWDEILRNGRKHLDQFFVDQHGAVVDFRRIYAAEPEIQEILKRPEVHRPNHRRSE